MATLIKNGCTRCGGTLLVQPADLGGSDTTCLACGHTPLSGAEVERRERLTAWEAAQTPLFQRHRRRSPSSNGMPI